MSKSNRATKKIIKFTKPVPTLPNEILQDIFRRLRKYTLRQTLLVNKHWCTNTIITFWQKPFHYSYDVRIIKTYLSFLEDDAEKQRLLDAGVEIPSKIENRIFEIPSMLVHLKYYGMIVAVKNLVANRGKAKVETSDNTDILNLIIEALLGLFVRKEVKLVSLSSTCDKGYDPFLRFVDPKYFELTKNLKELYIDSKCRRGLLFKWAAGNCRNLRSLEINLVRWRRAEQSNRINLTDDENLTRLICAQNELQYFKISHYARRLEMKTQLIVDALATQANTLQHVIFDVIGFSGPLEGLVKCTNLYSLEFRSVYGLKELEIVQPLISAKFENLKKVVIVSGAVCEDLRKWADTHNKASN
ncbi:10141_t:CDS:2 [Ambispora gerdemannii]|uniref:10141_t:CDS:1 n=1 Tax=Ambispora gerdemannii TaxID=144530 RepID=A0A9N8V4L4_9GLOM|nr:10141_t:CDS:2 [Ambispora gerdemannii]